MEMNKLLDEAKTNAGLSTDVELAKYLGVAPARISQFRGGYGGHMSGEVVVRLARMAERDPVRVLLRHCRDKATGPSEMDVWGALERAWDEREGKEG